MSDQYKENDPIEVYDGDDKTLRFTTEDDDGATVGITGFDITFTLYEGSRADTQIFQKDTSGGDVTITDADNGEFEVNVDGGDWEQGYGKYYEAEGTDSSGEDQTLAVGQIHVLENKS